MSRLGPRTKVKLWSGIGFFGDRCGYETWFDAAVLLAVVADVVLVIFQGLDLIHRGINEPTLQFAFTAAIALLYSLLLIVAIAMYQWERVLAFRYRWVFAIITNTILSWTIFGVYASWVGWYGIESSVGPAEGSAFITWIAINGLGIAMFGMKLMILFISFALHYTFMRVIELSTYTANAGAGQTKTLETHLMDIQIPIDAENANDEINDTQESAATTINSNVLPHRTNTYSPITGISNNMH
jgi:hypothetical protein